MLSKIKRFATNMFSRLSSAANRLFRRITQPARSNMVTGTLADLPRSRTELLAENALLRQQLIVLHRRTKTPRLTWRERLSLLFLARWVPNWKQVLQIQDFRLDGLKSWNVRVTQFSPQVIAQQIGFDLVKRFARLLGFDLQKESQACSFARMS